MQWHLQIWRDAEAPSEVGIWLYNIFEDGFILPESNNNLPFREWTFIEICLALKVERISWWRNRLGYDFLLLFVRKFNAAVFDAVAEKAYLLPEEDLL